MPRAIEQRIQAIAAIEPQDASALEEERHVGAQTARDGFQTSLGYVSAREESQRTQRCGSITTATPEPALQRNALLNADADIRELSAAQVF